MEEELIKERENSGITFEAALKRLEEVVSKLENGELPLEEALECFKEGIKLVKICNEKLKNAETVISQLIEEEDDNVFVKPLDFNLEGD
ncbi:MAG TPA: exodeoxyribonuclease VII small subunit [Peptococcaceae bacterium]|nr:MAG: Exodeoxyribonuclease VII small subunit [Clostridia bacterium 41_269]HBT20449.1 exodeoxyribonuclease VII small subunit [Peptococcaceae bacterium]